MLVENRVKGSLKVQYSCYLFSINVHTRETCVIQQHVEENFEDFSQQVALFFREKAPDATSEECRHKRTAGKIFHRPKDKTSRNVNNGNVFDVTF